MTGAGAGEFVIAMKSPVRGFRRVLLASLYISGVLVVIYFISAAVLLFDGTVLPLRWALIAPAAFVGLTLTIWLVTLPFAGRFVRHPTRITPGGVVLGTVGWRVTELFVPWSAIERIWIGCYGRSLSIPEPKGSVPDRFRRRFPHPALFIRFVRPESVADGKLLATMRTNAGNFAGAHVHLELLLAKVPPDEVAAAVHRFSGGRLVADLI